MFHFYNLLPPPFRLYNLHPYCKHLDDTLHFLLIFMAVWSIMPDRLLKLLTYSCGIACVCFLNMWKRIYPSDVILFFVFLLFSSQHTRQLVFATVILFLIFYHLLNSQKRGLGGIEKQWFVLFVSWHSLLLLHWLAQTLVRRNLCASFLSEHFLTKSGICSLRAHEIQ